MTMHTRNNTVVPSAVLRDDRCLRVQGTQVA